MKVQVFKRKIINGSRIPFLNPLTLEHEQNVLFVPIDISINTERKEVIFKSKVFSSKQALLGPLKIAIIDYKVTFKKDVIIEAFSNRKSLLASPKVQTADFRNMFASKEINNVLSPVIETKINDSSFYNNLIFTTEGANYFLNNIESTTPNVLLSAEWDTTPFFVDMTTGIES